MEDMYKYGSITEEYDQRFYIVNFHVPDVRCGHQIIDFRIIIESTQ